MKQYVIAIAALVALCASLAGASVAIAHARYDHSTPPQGLVVSASPPRVGIYTVQDMQKTAGTYQITVQRADARAARAD